MKPVKHTCPWPGEICKGCKSKHKPHVNLGYLPGGVWSLGVIISDALDDFFGKDRHGNGIANRFHVQFMQVKDHPELLIELVDRFVTYDLNDLEPYFTTRKDYDV